MMADYSITAHDLAEQSSLVSISKGNDLLCTREKGELMFHLLGKSEGHFGSQRHEIAIFS